MRCRVFIFELNGVYYYIKYIKQSSWHCDAIRPIRYAVKSYNLNICFKQAINFYSSLQSTIVPAIILSRATINIRS